MRPELRQAGEGTSSVVMPRVDEEGSVEASRRAVLAGPFVGEVGVVDDCSSADPQRRRCTVAGTAGCGGSR